MQYVRLGDRSSAAAEVRAVLTTLGLLPHTQSRAPLFDAVCERAVRAFQQQRGLVSDGVVGPDTWRALEAARYQLGDRILAYSAHTPTLGDDVRHLQERLLEIGYDVGRPDGVYSQRTQNAVRRFQRECGARPDGVVGPGTIQTLKRLGRKVVGGRPQLLRESARANVSGPRIQGKQLVIDPGHGGDDRGSDSEPHTSRTLREAELCYEIATRLQGRFAAIGGHAELTRGAHTRPTPAERAQLANTLGADVFISLHIDHHPNPEASGISTYHFGTTNGVTSTLGERLAGIVQRELVARTKMLDCHTHAKTWETLRLTRMPAVHVELGYLTSPSDAALWEDPTFADTVTEALLVAVQRIFLPLDNDAKTGTLDLTALRELQLL